MSKKTNCQSQPIILRWLNENISSHLILSSRLIVIDHELNIRWHTLNTICKYEQHGFNNANRQMIHTMRKHGAIRMIMRCRSQASMSYLKLVNSGLYSTYVTAKWPFKPSPLIQNTNFLCPRWMVNELWNFSVRTICYCLGMMNMVVNGVKGRKRNERGLKASGNEAKCK